MAIGVVGIHSGVTGLQTLGRLGVPFFLIASSYFFFTRFDFNSNSYLKKYLKRIFLLYLSWQILFTPLLIMQFKEDLSGNYTLLNILKQFFELLLFGEHNGWGQSWYLLAILYGLPILIYLLKRLPLLSLFILFIGIEFYFVLTQGYYMFLPSSIMIISPLTTVRALPYLFLGYLLVTKIRNVEQVNNRKYLYIMLALFILFIGENIFIQEFLDGISTAEEVFLTMPTALLIFIWSVSSRVRFQCALFFRNFSTFLYVIHKAIISFIVRLTPLEQELIIFLITMSVALILYWIFLQMKKFLNWQWLNYLI